MVLYEYILGLNHPPQAKFKWHSNSLNYIVVKYIYGEKKLLDNNHMCGFVYDQYGDFSRAFESFDIWDVYIALLKMEFSIIKGDKYDVRKTFFFFSISLFFILSDVIEQFVYTVNLLLMTFFDGRYVCLVLYNTFYIN